MNRIVILLWIVIFISCQEKPTTESNQTNPMQAELLIDCKNELGEGAIWNHEKQEFWWIDIEGKKFFTYHPTTKQQKTYEVGERIGMIAPTTTGKAIVALQNGVWEFDLETKEMELIADPEKDLPNNRFNDGKCDPAGRLWVGSMALTQTPNAASLYRVEGNGDFKKMVDSVTISNGIIWSSDEKKMYYIDTHQKNVRAYDYDKTTGEITNEKVIIEVPESIGYPDGMTIDAEGMLWIALWNGNAVTRWNPNTGELLEKIEVPAHNISSCAFGGKNLDTLYITSARVDMTEAELKTYPHAGGVFKVVPGVKGVNANFFKRD